jgi:dihydroorotate dehydrogenase
MYKKYFKYTPIVIKMSPDLSQKELRHVANQLIKRKIDGFIAINTTLELDRPLIFNLNDKIEKGGISGVPLQKKYKYNFIIIKNFQR